MQNIEDDPDRGADHENDVEELPAYRPYVEKPVQVQDNSLEVPASSIPDHVIQSLRDDAQAYKDQALDPESDPHGTNFVVRYMARIEILEAYQFMGNLGKAPTWVDKNWLGSADEGPTLNVTDVKDRFLGTAKRGDWIVRQNTLIDDATSPGGTSVLPDHVAVIPASEFNRLYKLVPVPNNPRE